jgi:methionyl-tRNA formyltransferase
MPNDFLFPLLENQKEIKGAKLLTFNNPALKYHIPIYSCNDVKSAENLAWIRSFAPDLVLSIRFGKIFPDAFLKIPKLGVLNLHSGLLPNYRGVLAVFRALQNGDALIQATLHFIDDATIDTGRIVGFSTLAVSPNRSLLWHILNLYPQTIDLTLATIRALKEGSNISTFTQSAHQAAYYTFPTVAELEAFVAEGWKIVDVSEIESFYAMYKPD